jgi:ABC-type histidine transport system ATPase subunit
MLVVTHEMSFAYEVADRVVYMHDGVIAEQGPPQQLFTNPADKRTQLFLDRVMVKNAMLLLQDKAGPK